MTKSRYTAIVAECRRLIRERDRIQFKMGDHALEIEPMGPHGGSAPHDVAGSGVMDALRLFAEDIGVPLATVKDWRWVASRWPAGKRQGDVPFHIHRILAGIADERKRFRVITKPPVLARTGERRWTEDEARRVVGYQVRRPESVQEKVVAVHELVRDEEVASRVATDLLRRPEVAFQAMTDTTARHLVNRAQVDHARQGVEIVRQRTPALNQVKHTAEFLDLVGACAQFVASVGRIVPSLRGQDYTPDDRATVHRNLARVRAAADWIEAAVETGKVTPEEGLARLLRGE
ncbi:DUF6192 family protein [Krasilnikovia sp. MM14-A1259]|uniref:DUF6192 family protein n=1 Tax=Krasilnikovia sp. MM14-A1259 TaxID=3373539 RepID=UPI00399D22A5